MISRVLLYLNKDKPFVFEAAARCAELCRERGMTPLFFGDDAPQIQENLPGFQADFVDGPRPGEIDAMIVFGGDGTVLRALDSYVSCGIPLLGVNLGRMGFLLETGPNELPEALDCLRRGEYSIERRMMLYVQGVCGGKSFKAYATNEVSISRGLSQRMIAMDALVGNMLVDHYIADGLVLASPTGSTAYSLSAGGPIVSPDVQCFVLTPICPHSLQSRPIVISAGEIVRLRINMKEMREGIQLSVDGHVACEMSNHDEVEICRSPHNAMLIRFNREINYFSILKDKLAQWSL